MAREREEIGREHAEPDIRDEAGGAFPHAAIEAEGARLTSEITLSIPARKRLSFR